ncbi:MAG TPA: site-2 protease family protein [Anaerolineales bacterium]|nr:site-2 protease family protein [Anaerolineales bacterium]
MAVEQVEVQHGPDRVIAFYGPLYADTDLVFDRASERFNRLGYTAMLSKVDGRTYRLIAVRGVARPHPTRLGLHILLFVLTFLSAMLAGLSPAVDLEDPRWYLSGLPFALALMGILLAHELAHYFVARRYGSPVSLPYFVPMPMSILGTMGAVIFQRAPMRDRKALFDIGIAGPLAGLAVAIPLLIIGLLFTEVGRPAEMMNLDSVQQRLAVQCQNPQGVRAFFCTAFSGQETVVFQEGNSLIYLAAKLVIKGRILPDANGEDVLLSYPPSPGGPIAFAAWAGLLVTALNLLPIGQLDGGHVAYALLGRRAWTLSLITIGLLVALGGYLFLIGNPAWPTWIIWAVLALLLGPRHPPPLNEASPLGPGRTALGIFLLLVFVATFVPVPLVVASGL